MSKLDQNMLSVITIVAVLALGAALTAAFAADRGTFSAPFAIMAAGMLWVIVIDQVYRYKSRQSAMLIAIPIGFVFVGVLSDSLLMLADKFGMVDYL